jgi:hypothetical protein
MHIGGETMRVGLDAQVAPTRNSRQGLKRA